MKTNFMLRATIFAFCAVSIFACKDDDDNTTKTPDNQFIVDDTKVAIQATGFYYDPTASESPVDGKPYYRHWVNLLGPGFTVDGSTGSVTGEGDLITLGISGASANFDPGTYAFTGTEENPKAYELWDGRLDYDGDEFIFSEATLEISKDGDNYIVEFTAKAYPPQEDKSWLPDLTKTAKTISGYYSGTVISLEQD